MKHSLHQYLCIILPALLFAGCVTSDVVPLLATDDCGPKPENARAVAAAWLNVHCRFTPPNPFKPEELSATAPTRVATVDIQHGRVAGWQIILGPENKEVCNYTGEKYTRMIINRGRVVSIISDNHLSALIPPPPRKR